MEHHVSTRTWKPPQAASCPDYRASCLGKTPYPSKGAAKERIRHQERSHRRTKNLMRAKLMAYNCPHCGHWHVGSNGKAGR